MNRRRLVNRLLISGIALLLLGGAATLLIKQHSLAVGEVEPVAVYPFQPVPPFTAPPTPDMGKNPFSKDGGHWQHSVAKPPPKTVEGVAKDARLRGIIRLPGKEGILTDKGFVPLGQAYGGGTLKSVATDRIEISTPQGAKFVDLHPERRKLSERLQHPDRQGHKMESKAQ